MNLNTISLHTKARPTIESLVLLEGERHLIEGEIEGNSYVKEPF
jgi:hypothetical protein